MRHADTNEIVAEPIFVVHAHDLRQMSTFISEVSFDDFTWGDAEHTLVHPANVIAEVLEHNDDDEYSELLEDLEKVKAMGHLIAFDGQPPRLQSFLVPGRTFLCRVAPIYSNLPSSVLNANGPASLLLRSLWRSL